MLAVPNSLEPNYCCYDFRDWFRVSPLLTHLAELRNHFIFFGMMEVSTPKRRGNCIMHKAHDA